MNDEYEPYGDEWKAEVMKSRKEDIVMMFRKACMDRDTLKHWKQEGMLVLGEWESVWDSAGSPGTLGQSKAAAVREFILENAESIHGAKDTD